MYDLMYMVRFGSRVPVYHKRLAMYYYNFTLTLILHHMQCSKVKVVRSELFSYKFCTDIKNSNYQATVVKILLAPTLQDEFDLSLPRPV